MSAESPRHARSGGGPLTVPSQPPSDRSLIDAVSGFINDVTLSTSSTVDPKDIIQWARFETADINEPTPEGDSDTDISPLLLILGYGSGVQVWLIPPNGEAQEVLSWRQGTVRVLRILPTPQHGDCFASKRPLIALCDSASPGPTFCSLSFISIRGGEQVKSIKFKNPILDVLANKRSVVVSFSERFAVFDAGTLEDRMAITTCYPCPCPLGGSAPINPLALGDRWLAYADKKLNPSKRSSGGCEGEGVTSYTATVLHAAKSLSKGLRGLGETVAHSLAGGRGTSQSPSPPNADVQHPGSVTVLDIEGHDEDEAEDGEEPYDPIVAHFIAHSDAIIALKFDASGTLLVTADRRGHDFYVFRINPHPCGPSLASVHHLYILHRGDTTAKVQDIAISPESRWAAISTLRGTTHVFPLSPYGGACGVRTHTGPRVVNRLSRFHRSAGLPIHTATASRAGSPITVGDGLSQGAWYPNPRLPPYPLPTTVVPLAQLRPTANIPTHTITRTSSGRQRLSSLSEDSSGVPLLARARFGPPHLSTPPLAAAPRSPPATASLYLMAANGCLVQLLLHPRPARCVTKEKICDDSPIELDVEPIAQWPLQRPPFASDLLAPLPPSNPLLQPMTCRRCADICISEEERWLSQVEIVTHAGPHRRLWMGPQFVFKTYNCTGSSSSLSEAETVEVETSASRGVARSNPVNMPAARPLVPVIVDSGSASSLEHSPSDSFRRKSLLAETGRAASVCDVQLKEDLAEAMKEDHGWPREEIRVERKPSPGVVRAVDPLGTVVIPMVAPDPVIDDPDLYTHSNSDEATFRPVVRAPAQLSIHPEMVVRPLPRDTTIPVQTIMPRANISPEDEPVPLKSDVVIPVALSYVQSTNWKSELSSVSDCQFDEYFKESVVFEPGKQEATNVAKNVNSDILVFKKIDIKDLNRDQGRDECERDIMHERGLVDIAKRESKETVTLPKSNQATDDIHPTARVRIKKSPTPKPVVSDKNVSEASDKIIQINEEVSENKGVKEQHKVREKSVKDVRQTVDLKGHREHKTEKEASRSKGKGAKEKDSKSSEEAAQKNQNSNVKLEIMGVEKTNVHRDIVKDSQINKDNIEDLKSVRKIAEPNDTIKSTIIQGPNLSSRLDEKRYKKTELKDKNDVDPPLSDAYGELCLLDDSVRKVNKDVESASDHKNTSDIEKDKREDCSKDVTIKIPRSKKSSSPKSKKVVEHCVKTEDQAWDLLLNEQDKSTAATLVQSVDNDKNKEDIKPKSKRNRRKLLDEPDKGDENSFVEIHNIEENPQLFSKELVSISTPYENIESFSSYSSKLKKSRHSNITRETNDYVDLKPDDNVLDTELICIANSWLKSEVPNNNNKTFPEPDPVPKIEVTKDLGFSNISQEQWSVEKTINENTSTIINEQPKSKKCKSLSPFPVYRKANESEAKDVYVINTSEDNFPEIQITRGPKIRKSPQPIDRKVQEKELVTEKPVLSWSSIAASKKIKNVDQADKKVNKAEDKPKTVEEKSEIKEIAEEKTSSSVSLHDKLVELCKRTDIVVAECDTPTELNFFEEHHAVVKDLPPLEPLDFGFDDFNLEVMRDSLLEADNKVTSPICKINIDDILSSIKETTSKAIESSMFNLVDLEKIPAKKEKGFSVVESHKITTQEVKVDDEANSEEKEVEVMEKSSDEDPSPVLSTDSDKEDKKNSGASSTLIPSAKQSVKAKKSRKKKK